MNRIDDKAHNGTQRAPIKQRLSHDIRVRQQSRARQMTTQLRKAKKSHLVSLKRRCGPHQEQIVQKQIQGQFQSLSATSILHAVPDVVAGNEAKVQVLSQLAIRFMEGGENSADALHHLQEALSSSDMDTTMCADALLRVKQVQNTDPALLEQEEAQLEEAGIRLVDQLAKSLKSNSALERLDASRILTNLAAGESSGNTEYDTNDVYGGAVNARGWCSIITRSKALGTLISLVGEFVSSHQRDKEAVILCEQCCWALGNIAGDSQRSRSALMHQGAIRPLVCALRIAFKGLPDATIYSAGLCRNITWALCNILRGGIKNSSLPFLELTPTFTDLGPLLTSADLYQLILAPELKSQTQPAVIDPNAMSTLDGEVITIVTWEEVALEACWLVAFLTAKEDEAVEFLCQDGKLFEALETRTLKAIVDLRLLETSETPPLYHFNSPSASQVCVPCVRILGNIATACYGSFGTRLLQYCIEKRQQQTNPGELPASLVDGLSALLVMGSSSSIGSYNDFYNYGSGGEMSAIATEAAWAVGSLLCDAGLPFPHPATTSCEIFLPALCKALISPNSSLALKREALSALLNAVSPPPLTMAPNSDVSQISSSRQLELQIQQDITTIPVQLQMLQVIIQTTGVIPCLVQFLHSTDLEVVLTSVRLVDTIYRKLLLPDKDSAIKRKFDELNLLDQLELICDKASTMYSATRVGAHQQNTTNLSSAAADVAADLIDDYYGDDIAEDHEEGIYSIKPATVDGSFAFGNTHAPGVDLKSIVYPPLGMGRGRGRGKNVPAWMQHQS